MKLNEAIEYLEEAASGPFLVAFNKDTQIFPIKLAVKASSNMDSSAVVIYITTAAGKSLGHVINLTALRMAAFTRTTGLGGKAQKGGGIGWVKLGDFKDSTRDDRQAKTESAVKILSKKLGVKAVKGSGMGPGSELHFDKSYNDLESLSQDLDKVAK